ncbi:unnamed protein product [Cuscuta epithymum]|uniref:Uncharacterized protein n=1 Tax=Cuscuta epithymum TaxID=186058 RepID=A0AAV0E4R3_9ASTE|nr:unnamed protein product [Cuscuta epithymum]CAH9147367.1 unnamed protein product [Cuscuta epithymum]
MLWVELQLIFDHIGLEKDELDMSPTMSLAVNPAAPEVICIDDDDEEANVKDEQSCVARTNTNCHYPVGLLMLRRAILGYREHGLMMISKVNVQEFLVLLRPTHLALNRLSNCCCIMYLETIVIMVFWKKNLQIR